MKKAVYAGSFDPITNGHLWVIEKSSKLFDEVIILIAENPSKSSLFNLNEKLQIAKEACKSFKNVKVKSFPKQFTVDYCIDQKIQYIIRGIRNTTDLEYEKTILQVNRGINDSIETIFLMPPPELANVSSSIVKSLLDFPNWQEACQKLVPPSVLSYFLKKKYENLINLNFISKDLSENLFQPHRFYHNAQHILELQETMAKIPNLTKGDKDILTYAIYFHDIVYDPTKNNNEELSSAEWIKFSKTKSLSTHEIDLVSEMILATKNHANYKSGNMLVNLFLDLDLSILFSSNERFKEYDRQIKCEYNFVPDTVYLSERYKILSRFLNDKYILKSAFFSNKENYEKIEKNITNILKNYESV